MTLLAVPITKPTTEAALGDIERALAGYGADAVELRLDYMPRADLKALVCAVPNCGKVIVTARDPAEGGVRAWEDSERIAALLRAAEVQPEYIDLELATWQRYEEARTALKPVVNRESGRPGRAASCQLILSAHDFDKRPGNLDEVVAAMQAEPCAVVKVVWQAESICDVFTAFDLMRKCRAGAGKPVIAIVMGEAGMPSRILARKFGAFLSFASIADDAGSAPGQITIDAMKRLYRWDDIGSTTGVYGVIGCPIAHSMSPAIHNPALAERGVDGVYVPLRVEPGYENFEAFLAGIVARPWLDVRGLSVTIPHKENALRWIDEALGTPEAVEPLARRIGAVNTLVFDAPDKVRGLNTDYAGALDALTDAMACERTDLDGVPVAVIGAGGASRAVVAGLRQCGCHVTIYNRTYNRAVSLAEEFGCQPAPLAEACKLDAQIVVNTTSLGMHPNVDETPLPADALRPGMVVFDNVYNPMETRLLREAAAIGCRTVSGVEMFVNQAVTQFEAWTGRRAPRELMRRVVVGRLSAR